MRSSSNNLNLKQTQSGFRRSIHADAFELKHFESDSVENDCNGLNLTQCSSLKRIGIILNKFKTYNNVNLNKNKRLIDRTNTMTSNLLAIYQSEVYGNEQPMIKLNKNISMYDFINFKLSEKYNNVILLNDFHHLLFSHNSDNEFQQIYNDLKFETDCKCTASLCYNSDYESISENIFEIETIETMNRIHCYFVHSMDIGNRLSLNEMEMIESYQQDERLSIIYKLIHAKHHTNDLIMNQNKYMFSDSKINKIYYYWDSFKTHPCYITPKYANLKEELLQQLKKERFDLISLRTAHIMQCNKTKTLRANRKARILRQYLIKKRSQITMQHIFVLLIYCNHHSLQQSLSQSYASPSQHGEFAHCAKYIRECTQVYGQSVRSDAYHCTDNNYISCDLMLAFVHPSSCTSSVNVAVHINIEIHNGLMLKLGRYSSGSTYFDCKWLSHNVSECEMLFASSNHTECLKIVSILDIARGLNYRCYISAMHVLNAMIDCVESHDNSKPNGNDARSLGLLMSEQTEKRNIPFYVDKLFTVFCCNHTRIDIDIDKLNDVYYATKKYLISFDDTWCDLNTLCFRFKNVKQIVLKGLRLSDVTFKRFLKFIDSSLIQKKQCKLSMLVLKYPKEEDIAVEEAIKKYSQPIQYRNWCIFHYQETHDDDLITIYCTKNDEETHNPDIDAFAFELCKSLHIIDDFRAKQDIEATALIRVIQKRFPNTNFHHSDEDDIWSMIHSLEHHLYIKAIRNDRNTKSEIYYHFEWDKYRSFIRKTQQQRSKWTIGTKIQIYSSYHASWRNGIIVDERNDILTVLFDDGKATKTVDRFQHNIIREQPMQSIFSLKKSTKYTQSKGNIQFATSGSLSKRESLHSINATAPSSRRSTMTMNSAMHQLAQDGSQIFTPQISPNLVPQISPDVFLPNLSASLNTVPAPRSQRSTVASIKSTIAVQPEFAPCPGDPFWEYYRTIGDLSRANCQEVIKVMQWISAEDIMRTLLQNWIHKKIEPIELPYINDSNILNRDNFSLQSTAIISFIRQSLNNMCYRVHPDCFDITELSQRYEHYHHELHHEEQESPDWGTLNNSLRSIYSTDRRSTANNKQELVLNVIGINILSYLDQSSFLSACLVSRSWFFCSRFSSSRSHIKLRIWNALKYLIRDADLNDIITGSNDDIICIDEFMRDRKVETNINIDECLDTDAYDDDILLNYVIGKNKKKTLNRSSMAFISRKSIKNQDSTHSLYRFFSRRVECCMFSKVCKLQFDFNISSNNKLIYYINQSLLDSYWDTLSILFQIQTLSELDLLFPDPHVLLLSYILQNSSNYRSYSKRIIFPSIGIPKSKCINSSKQLKSVRFAVKSLTLQSLQQMLDTHFQHYHHPIHYIEHNHNSMYAQSHKYEYSKLKIYRLCNKVINKALIFDISNLLHDLNHSSVKVNKIQSITLCDVKCLNIELTTFLNNNGNTLKGIDVMFTQKCLTPQNNNIPITSTASTFASPSLPPGMPPLTGRYSSTMSFNIGSASLSSITYDPHHPQNGVSLSNIDANKKKVRTQKVLTELFHAIIKYFKKQRHIIHAHNHQIKKSFKLAKNMHKNDNNYLEITYANKLKILPLDTLSFSFPVDVDIFFLDGFVDLFSWFEMNDCSEISLKHIHLDGGWISPFALNDDESNLYKWNDFLRSQMFNIETFIMHRVLYSSLIFDHFSEGFVSNLKHIDLQLIFNDPYFEYDDPLSSMSNLMLQHEPQSSLYQIKDLLLSLQQCQQLEICCLDLIQYSKDYNATNTAILPVLDILWIDEFMKSTKIKKTITKLKITFNELSTMQFSAETSTPKFIKRGNGNLGAILRINKTFKNEIEQLIMSWFTHCNGLNQTTFIRHFDTIQSNRYKDDENIDFEFEFDARNNDEEHNIAYYDVIKRSKKSTSSNSEFCGGEVFGELIKILQPQNPIE